MGLRSWAPLIGWLVGARVGSKLIIVSRPDVCLVSRKWLIGCLYFQGAGAKTQLQPRYYLWFDEKLCFCGQQTWGFVPKTIWCRPESDVLRTQKLRKGVDVWLCKGGGIWLKRGKWVTVLLDWARLVWIKGKVILKKWNFCVVTPAT